ncbi:uncharacterized protein mettl21ca [Aulostomus maculatus]
MTEESGCQKQKKPLWSPCFFSRLGKEVYYYIGEKIIIEEGLDSFAGMIWPAALALCQYLDTHRQQLSLLDKAVLEVGAGTGLLSIVASLLGAWVTATDLPEALGMLRCNLSRNTRGRCRHTPQVAALTWGYDLERTYPTSVYRYDYVLAADVVYHHDFLDELLATMKHFCKPGTTLIWANKVRFESDLTFTDNFKKAFDTTLLAEDGEMKIYMAVCREEEREGDTGLVVQDGLKEKEGEEAIRGEFDGKTTDRHGDKEVTEDLHILESGGEELECDEEEEMSQTSEEIMVSEDDDCEEEAKKLPENRDSSCSITASTVSSTEQAHIKQTAKQQDRTLACAPNIHISINKDIYRYAGQDILINESIDSYGAVMWPAALALCSFLDNNREQLQLQGKEVLELGAGTGLVTIVASLLGASVTATDLPEVLGNLTSNVMRNTRGRCRCMPKVQALPWGYDLERTYRYDYVLAADVVYHHDFLDELLATMKHFCKPGTTLIWANKVRLESDLTFTDNFKKAFDTTLLAEDGEMKIYMGTSRK